MHLIFLERILIQLQHGLRRRSAAACLLRLWVRIPPAAWMIVCCECFVCCQVEVSVTIWSLVQTIPTDCGASLCVWPRNLANEETLTHWGMSHQKQNKKKIQLEPKMWKHNKFSHIKQKFWNTFRRFSQQQSFSYCVRNLKCRSTCCTHTLRPIFESSPRIKMSRKQLLVKVIHKYILLNAAPVTIL